MRVLCIYTDKDPLKIKTNYENKILIKKFIKDYKNVDGALQDSVGVAIKTEPDKAKVIKEIFRDEYTNQ